MTSDKGLQFIKDTEYSARCLFQGIQAERDKLASIQTEIMALRDKSEDFKQEANRYAHPVFQEHEPFSRVFLHAARKHGGEALDKEVVDLSRIKQEFLDKQLSLAILSGGILQIAKHGITIVHGSLSKAPNTRKVCDTWLADIVWHGRNQSVHFDERAYLRREARLVFNRLKKTYGQRLSLRRNRGKNLASEVLDVLGWNSYESYEADLRDLL